MRESLVVRDFVNRKHPHCPAGDHHSIWSFCQTTLRTDNHRQERGFKPSHIEFALYHANQMKSSLWYNEEIFSWKIIVRSGDFRCMSSLIKYGYNFSLFGKECFDIMKGLIEHCLIGFYRRRPLTLNNLKSDRRKILFIQTAYLLVYGVNLPMDFKDRVDLLYLIWQAVSDSYLTYQELADASFELKMKDSDWLKLCHYYETYVTSPKSFDTPMPRSLAHFCRCKIRATLSENYALPDGIEKLDIPDSFKAFLRLEKRQS
ncbi:SOCS box domain-containing protein [Nephila pilipes]|uniref:SOCS box domain-containing protein n=1 Tax=Nephila pilipes TaxID=299642 RepID=A0A8X6T6P2_NEPPI|nr:SOCS box domain-containing protein [Nephila pilipes]